jgi:hypothetical protein
MFSRVGETSQRFSADHPGCPGPSQRADDPDLYPSHERNPRGADRPVEPADARPLSAPRGRHAVRWRRSSAFTGLRISRASPIAFSPASPGSARPRSLSDAGLGRPRASVRSLRPAGVCVSFLPQPPLSEVSPRPDRPLADGATRPPVPLRLLLTSQGLCP